jgi:hypothetical protein
MADLDGYGTRNAWAAFDITGKKHFFVHKCDFNEAVRSGNYFLNSPIEGPKEVKVEEKAADIPEITISEKGLKRVKIETKEQ